ncbi:MAG: NADPH:quinone oxidoreductase family protein [Alphaproteobacteria bacterium]|nr:NADPH:quinone oxidoreductase family protein [Alphaproteobacteria bacterium]
MVALFCDDWCEPAGLRLGEPPTAAPGPGEIAVTAEAGALNFADTLMVAGKYQVKPPFPFTPGFEAAGTVEAVGAGVRGFAPGDRVFCALQYGGLASRIVAPEQRVFPMPKGMDARTAAAWPVIYGTSHIALTVRGRLQAGETLLVLGATSGVGLAAIEIGKALGARVIAQVRGAAKGEAARAAGADAVVDSQSESLRDAVKALTDGQGADVVYDPVGGDLFDEALRCVRWGARLLIVGFAAGRIQQIPANLLLVKGVAAVGVFWNAHFLHDAGELRRSFADLARMHEAGQLHPPVRAVLPAADYARAYAMLLDRNEPGKIVLELTDA